MATKSSASVPATALTNAAPRLVIKILYPRVCVVWDCNLDAILEVLHKSLSDYSSITLHASRSLCEEPANVGLWKSTMKWIMGDTDSSAPYCKTAYAGGTSSCPKTELEHTLLIEVLTNNKDGLTQNEAKLILSTVEGHIKKCEYKILPIVCLRII